MSAADNANPTVIFRCPKELEGRLPSPEPAIQALPGWLKTMPAQAFSSLLGGEDDTVKRCPPFIDAMTFGFVIPLMCDLAVQDGQFTWDNDLPPSRSDAYPRSPIGFHDPSQATGAPFFDEDRFLIKFHNLWTIETPEGYSLLFTHPANRFDLPFRTLTGLVDCDLFHDAWINFPAVWLDQTFSGVLPRGTPVAQCYPIKRETWSQRTVAFFEDDARRAHRLVTAIRRDKGVYRRRLQARGNVKSIHRR